MTVLAALASPLRRFALAVAVGLDTCGLIGNPKQADAQALPDAKPEAVGLSSDGLAKIGDGMRAKVAASE